MADKRTQQEKLNDARGGPNGVPTKADQGRQRDAKHQGPAKK
jgi:hypothetical protein